jgi:hypothetical protein
MSWKRWIAAAILLMQLPVTLMAKPAGLPLDQRINYAAEAPVPIAPADQPSSPDAVRAAEIFKRAERQQRRGELNEARRGFEEVHLLAPISRVGQQAIDRLRQLEMPGNDFAEEQEPPLNPPAGRPLDDTKSLNSMWEHFLEMLRQTRPLGTGRNDEDAY